MLKSLGSSWACAADNDTDTNSGGTVTSVTAGAGLTATPNPITTAGTVAIATSYQLPQGCSNGQVAEWSGSAWVCANDDNSGGTVTGVTASAPLQSSGGNAPNITLPNVIIGATNTAIGTSAFNITSTGDINTASGVNALFLNTTGFNNTASGVAALRDNTTGSDNTASGVDALQSNTTGGGNTASGTSALLSNTTGGFNTAVGLNALNTNATGTNNTAIGRDSDVSADNLINATAIGAGAIVNDSNKIRLGNAAVTVVESTGTFTQVSDKNQKENFKPVDGEEVLKKISGFGLTSWNFIGHDPEKFRHYGPMAQEFFAAFGNDGVGTIGTPTTIGSSDMAGILMIAVQALEKQNREVKAENSDLKARLEKLEKLVLAKETLARQ